MVVGIWHTQHYRNRDKWIPEVLWVSSLADLARPRLVRDPKKGWIAPD